MVVFYPSLYSMFYLLMQKDELVPLLVSVGCLTGEFVSVQEQSASPSPPPRSSRSQSRSPVSSVGRRRSVPRPQEVPGCSPGATSDGVHGRQQSVQPFELAGSPASPCPSSRTPNPPDNISDELQHFIDERLDASSSLREDEALAITHQLKELKRYR